MKKLLLAAITTLLIAGCYVDDPPPPPPPKRVVSGELSVDIREIANLTFTIAGNDLTARVKLTKGFGVAPADVLDGAGSIEAFPEAEMTLYTARFDAPADASGPCGDKPVSLALSLHRRGKDAHVGGSLAAYCGQGVWHGVPVRMLRLAGDLPP